jgi:hypothetical protein
LPAILALSLGAVLCGAKTLLAIAEWGRNHPSFAPALGFRHPLTPCVAALSNVFRALNAPALERVLARHFGALPPADGAGPSGWHPFAVDGKALRGTFSDNGTADVTLVAAYLHRERRVIDQEHVEGGDELGAVAPLAADPAGREPRDDRRFAPNATRRVPDVDAKRGAYALAVKGNQPGLTSAIEWALATRPGREATTCDRHGDRLEVLTLTLVDAAGIRWPGAAQVGRLERVRNVAGDVTSETTLVVTSLPAKVACAATLLGMVRGHWGIEIDPS